MEMQIDWNSLQSEIRRNGYAIIDYVLNNEECDSLIQDYNNLELYRKTVHMERYRFGKGEYKYFTYPLPQIIENLRTTIYPHLVPIANEWHRKLKLNEYFPQRLTDLQELCRSKEQRLATPLILKYGVGGYNTLHQDLYGEVYFPMQAVLMLSEPNNEYKGGEFVLTMQVPRAQSKAIVLRPNKGSMLIFPTNYLPKEGKRGYYKTKMKHGVSEVLEGQRYSLGIIFHDALK
ncbi:2OG-Fe(II) oxygenase [Muricauda sp. 2012CJ35-5]|uniref:2OG-Fe(II) oxygenase n=1 Tax=Flagellimonas spongiicola TaxID=2942208 RepID=A0ABT0PT50_9FLAO|nr:2OG-Fe(II) oxygenase [Allomuricauda spongiicola]MCL6274568.1 2OG-Fe(II) oxygenase [Allomuricauda spongiicola]